MLRSSDFNPDLQESKIGEKLVTSRDVETEKLRKRNAAQGLDIRDDPLKQGPVEIPKKEGEK